MKYVCFRKVSRKYDIFPLQNVPKLGDALSPFLLSFLNKPLKLKTSVPGKSETQSDI
jgi:hypothetical protein